MGYKPNKLFKEAIEYANANNLSGDALREYMDSIQPVHIEPHKEPLNFHKNIRPETEEEQGNVEMVLRDMNLLMVTPTIQAGAVMPDACPTDEGRVTMKLVIVR